MARSPAGGDMNWRVATLAVWAALGMAVVFVAALGRYRRGVVLTPGAVLRLVNAHKAGRVTLLILWMWLGWHLFAR